MDGVGVTTRMRLVGWEVRPVVMADDGDNLTPVPVNPQMIPASQWGLQGRPRRRSP